MKGAALIIGIDGWQTYTLPLIRSIQQHEPECEIVLIDNASEAPYPGFGNVGSYRQTKRKCYAAAINRAASYASSPDWYIVLSNDVLCTGPFIHILEKLNPDVVAGPCLKRNEAATYLEGWCVAASKMVWERLGGWDENFQISSWEDVDFSVSAVKAGFLLGHIANFPFVHLDQRQRFGLIPNYWDSERHNIQYFAHKHGLVA